MFLLENGQGKQQKIIMFYVGMQSRILQSTVNKKQLTMWKCIGSSPFEITQICQILLKNIELCLCYNLLKQSHTAIWNGKRVVVYEVAGDKSMVRAEGKTENLPKNTSL